MCTKHVWPMNGRHHTIHREKSLSLEASVSPPLDLTGLPMSTAAALPDVHTEAGMGLTSDTTCMAPPPHRARLTRRPALTHAATLSRCSLQWRANKPIKLLRCCCPHDNSTCFISTCALPGENCLAGLEQGMLAHIRSARSRGCAHP